MITNFFVSQFEGPTERFAKPHVQSDVDHPYTKAMVLDCFSNLAASNQSRITRNCRIYVAGSLMCPFESQGLIRKLAEARSFDRIDWTKLFGGSEFLVFLNYAALYCADMLSASKTFLGGFDRSFDRSGISIEHHVIVGKYAETSFGVHIDDATDRVFHFNLGPSEKCMELWPRREFLERYNGDIARPRRLVTHVSSKKYQMPVGSSFFLPADYHHVGSSATGVSAVVALAVSRQSEGLLLKAASQELCNLVRPWHRQRSYYDDFTSGIAVGQSKPLHRYDQIGLVEAHRHATARRLSNNSIAEIPDFSMPRFGQYVGLYALTHSALEVVDTANALYVYSAGHRAILRTQEQRRDFERVVAAGEFYVSSGSGLDIQSLALRSWLVATGSFKPIFGASRVAL